MESKEKPTDDHNRLKRFRKNLFRSLCGIVFIILLGWGASPFVKIGFNGTDSVDGYLFLIVKDVIPEKGELVAFWPPENAFYQNIWFVKYMKGKAGDEVVRRGQSFYINGEYIGDAKTESNGGVTLQPSDGGMIPKGYYSVWAQHEDSFDSRYKQIGWIPTNSIIGRAYRIL
ncbi:S26 family signal peptidase [Candidatus Enterovibrio escicola]|uniref:Conjugative signal peptidase TrhF n=1 Tax=Candidatus Enterovibrio escicola TaxID=1927127 RepID=A0A2A5T724_9GAMM|nr:S26 family signal peptidase [Candidatus Enterovibrio escacola]PCS24009.1 Conjugative signal peptidase TrhF [Candidatus Enterovibrio escacola]